MRFHSDGYLPRITFEQITRDSFTWVGERTEDDGATWTRALVIEARRIR